MREESNSLKALKDVLVNGLIEKDIHLSYTKLRGDTSTIEFPNMDSLSAK